MISFKDIQKISFELHSSDGMYNFSSDSYCILIKGDVLEISFKEFASWATEENPTMEKTKMFLVKVNEEIKQLTEHLCESFTNHKFHQVDSLDFSMIKLCTSECMYKVDANPLTTKSFIDFLMKINASSRIDMKELCSYYESIKDLDTQKEDLEVENKPKNEDVYPYVFAYTNSAAKKYIEIKINFDYQDNWFSGFKVLCKSITKKDGVYLIDEKTSVLPTNQDLKSDFERFFEFYINHEDQKSAIKDDFCTISYLDKNIKFSRKLFTSEFHDLLDFIFLGDESLDIPVDDSQYGGKQKYIYFRSGVYFESGDYSNDSDIEYIKFIDKDLEINDYCFCNCPNLKEVIFTNAWWCYKNPAPLISSMAFKNNPKMKPINFD